MFGRNKNLIQWRETFRIRMHMHLSSPKGPKIFIFRRLTHVSKISYNSNFKTLKHSFRTLLLMRKIRRTTEAKFRVFNSKAVGLDSWVQSALKSILRGGPYFWIGCIIFRYNAQIHFYIHFWNQNSRKKNSLTGFY